MNISHFYLSVHLFYGHWDCWHSSVGYYKWSCYEHSCANHCLNKCFNFSYNHSFLWLECLGFIVRICQCYLWWSVCSNLLCIFSVELFIFLLSFESSSCVVDISPLSDMWFAHIFSVYNLFFLLSSKSRILWFLRTPIYQFNRRFFYSFNLSTYDFIISYFYVILFFFKVPAHQKKRENTLFDIHRSPARRSHIRYVLLVFERKKYLHLSFIYVL